MLVQKWHSVSARPHQKKMAQMRRKVTKSASRERAACIPSLECQMPRSYNGYSMTVGESYSIGVGERFVTRGR